MYQVRNGGRVGRTPTLPPNTTPTHPRTKGAPMPTGTNPRHNGMSRKVLDYLKQRQNLTVTIEEIGKAVGANRPQQVSNSISHLRANLQMNIEVLARGVYIYRTIPVAAVVEPASKRLFAEVATLKDGTVIVLDESGDTLYRLSELT